MIYVFAATILDPGYGDTYEHISSRLHNNSNSPYSFLLLAVDRWEELQYAIT